MKKNLKKINEEIKKIKEIIVPQTNLFRELKKLEYMKSEMQGYLSSYKNEKKTYEQELPLLEKKLKEILLKIEDFDKEHPNIDKEMESIWAEISKLRKQEEKKIIEIEHIEKSKLPCECCGKIHSEITNSKQIEKEYNIIRDDLIEKEKKYNNLQMIKDEVSEGLISKKEEIAYELDIISQKLEKLDKLIKEIED
jgi:chromosome segregation ATPase